MLSPVGGGSGKGTMESSNLAGVAAGASSKLYAPHSPSIWSLSTGALVHAWTLTPSLLSCSKAEAEPVRALNSKERPPARALDGMSTTTVESSGGKNMRV